MIDIQHKTSTSLRHCSTDAAAEIHESDEFVEGLDAEEKATADVSILLNRLNSGLKSGLMKSHSILQNVEFLTSNGCVIPSSIFLNAGAEIQSE